MSRWVLAPAAAVLALGLLAGCGGPRLGMNYGTNYCTPSKVVDGRVVHATSGQPFEWTARRKRAEDVSIELGWGEHRRLKKKLCNGARHYTLEFQTKICFGVDGSVTSAEITRASESPEFDADFEKAAKKMRFCPWPQGTPPGEPVCVVKNNAIKSPCD